MSSIAQLSNSFSKQIKKYKNITVIAHINPDADTIGTSLGVYSWLKENGYRSEISCKSDDIPLYLDFLPNFTKIKNRIDFDSSLVITCDCGSMDRAGFDLAGRNIISIDHHASNTNFADLSIVDANAVSSSELAYKILNNLAPVSKNSAISFYTALVSDSKNFTTNNIDENTFELARELIKIGVDIPKVSYNMTQRKSLASLRILGVALDSLELKNDASIAIMKIRRIDLKYTGAKMSDIDGVIDSAMSLSTVEIAVLLVEQKTGVKVSVRSKNANVGRLAVDFAGGGHHNAGGFIDFENSIDKVEENILIYIEKKELI